MKNAHTHILKKTIVVSAVNLNRGGTLTILRDCLSYLSLLASQGEYRVIALVYDKELALYDHIEYIEMKWPKKSWVNRLFCEHLYMYRISKSIQPIYLWLSLHDTTPWVQADRHAVYCHNPFPFYAWKWSDLYMNYKILLFAWFSKFIYQVRIKQNKYIIVQQQWLKDAFSRMFHLDKSSIIVSPPTELESDESINLERKKTKDDKYHFLFAAAGANPHKNYELLCEAARLLEMKVGANRFKVTITLNGDENRYGRWLLKKWGTVKSIHFSGILSRDRLFSTYETTDCLVFPSKVETWGLPISEFGKYHKPMLLADLPYAHETGAGYEKVAFFPADNAQILAEFMYKLIEGDQSFLRPTPKVHLEPPVTTSWKEMFRVLLS